VLAGHPGVDADALLAGSAPDVGEAGAQVDAALASHVVAVQADPIAEETSP
jgi:3-carboxy-cis,cis-muconate cycloisomerase